MKKHFYLLLFTLALSFYCHAQVTWDRYAVFDTTGFNFLTGRPYTVHQTYDRGYVIGGNIFLPFNIKIPLWMKIDSLGNYVWVHKTSGGHNSNIWSVAEDQDSNLYLCGTAYGFPGDLPAPVIYKSDKDGNIKWEKSLTGNNITAAHFIISTFDGGTMVLANSSIIPNPLNYDDIILVKLDSAGIVQWSKSYGAANRETGYSVVQAADSGYIVCGFTESFGLYGMLIIRSDSNGNMIWSKVFSGVDFYEAVSVIQLTDLNFIATGYSVTYSNAGFGSGIVKFNSNGDTIWTKTLGYGDTLLFTTVVEADNNDLVFMGTKGYSGSSQIVRTDSTGQPIWARKIYNTNYLAHCCLGEQTEDGGFIVLGGTGFGIYHSFYNSKLDSNGFNNCNTTESLPVINYPTVQVINPALSVNSDTILSVAKFYTEFVQNDTILITNCFSVSITENNNSEFSPLIYPNPTSSQFKVSSELENASLEIFNMLGEKIYSAVYSGPLTVDCGHFPKGIYFVRLSNSETQLTQKLIIE